MDTNSLMSTEVDGSGVDAEVFPMTDDATLQVAIEPPRHRPYRRLVLIPQSQSTPGSVQDASQLNLRETTSVRN